MLKKRLISCLLIRDGLIVQSIGFRRYLPVGRPPIAVEFVAKWDVDEIILLDMNATPEKRLPDLDLIAMMSERVFVPLTVGGGITTLDDIQRIIRAGADKISINTHALAAPGLISRSADRFGSQCVVISIDALRLPNGDYEVMSDSGRRATGLLVEDWARTVERHGAGEILINSIDRDGSKLGYDIDLIRRTADAVSIPVIALGGVGKHSDFSAGILQGRASAVAAANIFHYIEHSTIVAKAHLAKAGIDVRLDSLAKYEGIEFDDMGRLLKRDEADLENFVFSPHKREAI